MSKIISIILLTVVLSGFSAATVQRKDCEELKKEIAAKLDAKGVKDYALDIVAAESVKDETVVGACDGGSKRIIYKRN